MKKAFSGILLLSTILTYGCYRGLSSEEPPIHPVLNMDTQYKYESYRKSNFFEDGISMRLPVAGTVARGNLHENKALYEGKDESGAFVKVAPVQITSRVMERGRERFNIYCSTCHSAVGDGKSVIINYGFIPPTFHDDRLRNIEDGYLFNVITNGIRTMPAYKHSVSVNDRWAIITYVRALQRSQHATVQDIPEDMKRGLSN